MFGVQRPLKDIRSFKRLQPPKTALSSGTVFVIGRSCYCSATCGFSSRFLIWSLVAKWHLGSRNTVLLYIVRIYWNNKIWWLNRAWDRQNNKPAMVAVLLQWISTAFPWVCQLCLFVSQENPRLSCHKLLSKSATFTLLWLFHQLLQLKLSHLHTVLLRRSYFQWFSKGERDCLDMIFDKTW